MIHTFPAKEFRSMFPKILEFTSSSLIPSARVSTLTGTSSSPLNCTSSVEMKKDTMLKLEVINEQLFYHLHVLQNFAQYLRVDARVIVIAIKNVKSFILISICYSFKKFIQIMFWFLVAVWRENVLLLWNYNVQYLL